MDTEVSTLIYFVITLILIFLIPWTYYSVRGIFSSGDDTPLHPCKCNGCITKNAAGRRGKYKMGRYLSLGLVVLAWAGVIWLARNVSSLEMDSAFDPFELLGLDVGASAGDVKESYRRLSYIHHPDRGGDSQRFVEISKAYKTLSDPGMRLNWEKHGNPDGPSMFLVGTALPGWMTHRENRHFIFGGYLLLLFVVLPAVVVALWRRGDGGMAQGSQQMVGYFLHKHRELGAERAMVCMSALQEFDPAHSPDIVLRYSDGVDMPHLLTQVPRAQQNLGENIFKQPYSLKARALLYSHVQRLRLEGSLAADRAVVLGKCPLLLLEVIRIFMSFVSMAHMGQVPHEPSVSTLESLIRLSVHLVQALPFDDPSPLLQLPHIDSPTARRLARKKIRSLRDLWALEPDPMRTLLDLPLPQFESLHCVLMSLPRVQIDKCDIFVNDSRSEVITPQCCVSFHLLLSRPGSRSPVHCPLFPHPLVESWVVYVCSDRHLMTPCIFLSDLVDSKSVDLMMTSPSKPGKYNFIVCVRSRCYGDVDATKRVQIVVQNQPLPHDLSTDSE